MFRIALAGEMQSWALNPGLRLREVSDFLRWRHQLSPSSYDAHNCSGGPGTPSGGVPPTSYQGQIPRL